MAQKILAIRDELNKSLRDTNKPWTKMLTQLEEKTGIDRLYLFIGGLGAVGLWLVFGFAGQLMCNVIGFLYPAYCSINAIETKQKDDDTKWLTYWVAYAVFSLVEFFADFIVGWFPLYWLAKCAFLIWLMIPSDFNGSIILYKNFIRPYFLKHQQTIDGAVDKVVNSATKLAKGE